MKRILIYILIPLFLVVSSQGKAQTINEFLVSKMDFFKQHTLWDGKKTLLMGYTRLFATPIDIPAPLLVFNEGDSIELKLRNMSQHAAHTIHLHGLDVDQANDGVPHLSFEIDHDSTGAYYFVAPHPGTYIYHCHVVSPLHVQAGMYGMLIVKPSDGSNTTWTGGYSYDTEKNWMLSEIDTVWHHDTLINKHHDPGQTVNRRKLPKYDPQYFLVNGRSENQLNDPSIAIETSINEKLYLRVAGIGYYGCRIHFPSQIDAHIVSGDGRPLPQSYHSDSIEIYPGERFAMILETQAQFIDSIRISYFNLNTGIVENDQYVPISSQGVFEVDDNKALNDFSVYPNPASDQIELDFPMNIGETYHIEIIDLSGRKVYEYGGTWNGLLKIDVSQFKSGSYILNFSNKGTEFKSTFIISH